MPPTKEQEPRHTVSLFSVKFSVKFSVRALRCQVSGVRFSALR